MKNLMDTGIPGLNEILGGGLPEGSITIISGAPGLGKSAIAMQYLYAGLEKGEPGIFLSIENSIEEVIGYAQRFGWDYMKHEEQKNLKILDRTIFEEADMELGLDFGVLKDIIENLRPKRFVLDSVTLFNYIFRDEVSRRQHMLRLVDLLKVYHCTTIMTSEQDEDSPVIKYNDWHYLADCLVALFWNRNKSFNQRNIWAVKVKGQATDNSIRPYKMTEHGAVIMHQETPSI